MSTNSIKKMNPVVQMVIRIFISVGLIASLSLTIDWHQLGSVVKESSLLYILFAFIAIQLTVFASVVKWKLLVDAAITQHKSHSVVSSGRLAKLYYVGLFFNNFLPSSVGGDVMRIYQLGRRIGMTPAAASVGVERLTSGVALVMILLISSLLHESVRPFFVPIVVLVILFFIIFLLLWLVMKKSENKNTRVEESVKAMKNKWLVKIQSTFLRIGEIIGDYRKQNWLWWSFIAIFSFAFQIGLVWINDLLFQALGVDVSFLELLVVITLISALTMLPISINGLGIREVSYIFFFQGLGIANEVAVSVSLLFFILVAISSLAGGLFWLSEKYGE